MKKCFIPLFFVLLGCGEHTLDELLGGLIDSSSSNGSSDVSSSSGGGSNSGGGGDFSGNSGTFVDSRDGTSYKWVRMDREGNSIWMAENLNYDVPYNNTDVCYNNDPDNCAIYGRLYNWETAMKLTGYTNVKWSEEQPWYDGNGGYAFYRGIKHQGICPNGWHIPNNWDTHSAMPYEVLMNICGPGNCDILDACSAGCDEYDPDSRSNDHTGAYHLKAKQGWDNCGPSGSGTRYRYRCEDTYGFSALPAGWGSTLNPDYFRGLGHDTYWWTIQERIDTEAWYKVIVDDDFFEAYDLKMFKYSIRCVKD